MSERDTAAWAADHGVTIEITVDHGIVRDRDGWEHHAYDVRLHLEGRTIETPYRMGTGLAFPPVAWDVLDSLVMDAQAGELSFPEYLGEYGGCTDAQTAAQEYETWQACQGVRERLAPFLGGQEVLDHLIAEVERM